MYNQNIQNLQTDQMKQNEMLDEYAVYVMCDICTQKLLRKTTKEEVIWVEQLSMVELYLYWS